MGTFGAPDSLFGSPHVFGESLGSSNYGAFIVQLWNPDNTISIVPAFDVLLYDATNLVDLGITLTSDSDGIIAAGSLALAVGTIIRFRVEDDGHGRAGWCYQTTVADASPADGMNLLIKPSGGQNILFWPMAVPPYYKAATVSPVRFDIYYRELPAPGDDPTLQKGASSAIFVGSYNVGQQIEIPFNPASDKTVRVTQMPFNAFGVPAYRSLEDAEAHGAYQDFVQDRNSGTPVIAQFTTATTTGVTIKVSGFNQFIVGRRVTSADDSGFTTGVLIKYFDLSNVSDKTYQFFDITATSGTQTKHIKIAHSTNGHDVNASWGANSNVLDIIFAGTGGGGGSPGGGDPTPPDRTPLYGY